MHELQTRPVGVWGGGMYVSKIKKTFTVTFASKRGGECGVSQLACYYIIQ